MSPTPYSVRPSDNPPPIGSRVVLAHLLSGVLNAPGSPTVPLDWRAVRRASREGTWAKAAYARAVHTVAGSEVFCPPWREGQEGHWMHGTRFDVDYTPNEPLRAVEALFVAAGFPKPHAYPLKTTLSLHDGVVSAAWGYGGEYVWYHPLADGRVLVSTRVLRLTAEQAETLAEGKHPDVEVLTMASGAGVFRWTDYLRNVIGLPDSAPA